MLVVKINASHLFIFDYLWSNDDLLLALVYKSFCTYVTQILDRIQWKLTYIGFMCHNLHFIKLNGVYNAVYTYHFDKEKKKQIDSSNLITRAMRFPGRAYCVGCVFFLL